MGSGHDAAEELFEEADYANEIGLSILSRYIGCRPDGKTSGGVLNATKRSVGRGYVDGHASYGVDWIEGFNRRNGTPLIALDAHVELKSGQSSRFTKLWFVEIDETRVEELRRRVKERGASERAKVVLGDINSTIVEILLVPAHATDLPTMAVVQLDPVAVVHPGRRHAQRRPQVRRDLRSPSSRDGVIATQSPA